MEFIKDLLFVFLFFGPAGLANLAAFLASKIPFLKLYGYPVDFGLKINGKRILGNNKTIRGFIAGIIVAILTVYLEIFLYTNFSIIREIIPIDYTKINPIILGTLFGFGALAGDAIKSFFKRQVNIPPGKSWVPFDQTDAIIGGILFSAFYIRLSLYEYILIFIIFGLLHPFNNLLGYFLKLKKEPF